MNLSVEGRERKNEKERKDRERGLKKEKKKESKMYVLLVKKSTKSIIHSDTNTHNTYSRQHNHIFKKQTKSYETGDHNAENEERERE